MRITSIAVLTLAVCGAALAATRSETATYVDGNLTGVSPKTGATLTLADDSGITLKAGSTTVEVPYSGVSHAELGAVKDNQHNPPLFKVWDLNRRFAHKTQTQLLIVNFKNADGEEKSMTLELAKSAAPSVLTTIQSHAGNATAVASTKSQRKSAAAKQEASADDSWWGDKYWKTKNNQDKWNKPSVANAPEQQ